MGNRPTDEAEMDAFGPLKANGLDRARNAALDLREMRGEDHVRATFPNLELVFHRTGCLLKVRTRDDVEDGFTIGCDLPGHGSEVTNPPAGTAVDGAAPLA